MSLARGDTRLWRAETSERRRAGEGRAQAASRRRLVDTAWIRSCTFHLATFRSLLVPRTSLHCSVTSAAPRAYSTPRISQLRAKLSQQPPPRLCGPASSLGRASDRWPTGAQHSKPTLAPRTLAKTCRRESTSKATRGREYPGVQIPSSADLTVKSDNFRRL